MRLQLHRHWQRVIRWDGFWWITGAAAALALGTLLSWVFWEDLRGDDEPLSATVRNLGLVIGGVIAVLLALWRSRVSERQATTAQEQADIAQRGLLNERYQKGADMLGSPVLSVRLGGIYALQRLAAEHSEEYHIQIMRLFCAFVRNQPSREEDTRRSKGKPASRFPSLREDVQAILEAFGNRREKQFLLERRDGFRFDLHGTNLSHAEMSGINLAGSLLEEADLSGANLSNANLSGAQFALAILDCTRFEQANLSKAWFASARLSGAMLCGADLSNAELSRADLNGAALCGANLTLANLDGAVLTGADLDGLMVGTDHDPVVGLTQAQLDRARVDENDLPMMDGVADAETGEPLVWRGASTA